MYISMLLYTFLFVVSLADSTRATVWYGDGAGNTVEENSSDFSLIQMR